MTYVKWINELSKEDEDFFGDKAANLGELMKLGLPVPKGFGVSSEAFSLFISKFKPEIDAIVAQVDFSDFNSIHEAARQIHDIFMTHPLPAELLSEITEAYKQFQTDTRELQNVDENTMSIIRAGRDLAFVAVRPSVIDKYAPLQQLIQLNVKGEQELVLAIKQCWASLYSARALYFQSKNQITSPSMAVVIQKMVDSTKSGDLFTVNPITNNRNQVLIHARWGYSQRGASEPNIYTFDKTTKSVVHTEEFDQSTYFTKDSQNGKMITRSLPEEFRGKSLLSQREMEILTRVGEQIESHFQFPQDIEWCAEKNNVYIVQSRPITKLFDKPLSRPGIDQAQISNKLLEGLPIFPGRLSGAVKLIQVPEDSDFVDTNSILVLSELTNDFTPAAFKSGAIVAEKGNIKSYTATLAREFAKPCLIKTRNATTILQEGQSIDLDANSGLVLGETPQPTLDTPAPMEHKIPGQEYSPTDPTSEVLEEEANVEEGKPLDELQDSLAEVEQFMTDKFFDMEEHLKKAGLNPEEASRQLKEIEWKIREIRRKVLGLTGQG